MSYNDVVNKTQPKTLEEENTMTNYEIAKAKIFETIDRMEDKGREIQIISSFAFGMVSGLRVTGFLTDDELNKLSNEVFDRL